MILLLSFLKQLFANRFSEKLLIEFYQAVDVVFVLDSSNSLRREDWAAALKMGPIALLRYLENVG